MKQFEKSKDEIKNKILKYVKDGLRFAVSFDESTSVRNRSKK